MARVPFVPEDLAEPKDVVDAVRARRGGPLLKLDRLLLHSPALTVGWNTHLKAIRTQLSINAKLRELAILAIAVINSAAYEFDSHLPFFLGAGGTQAQADAVCNIDRALTDEVMFDAAERAVLKLAVEMTKNVKVSDATFAAAQHVMGGAQHIVELVATIATYNMVSRFLIALDLHP